MRQPIARRAVRPWGAAERDLDWSSDRMSPSRIPRAGIGPSPHGEEAAIWMPLPSRPQLGKYQRQSGWRRNSWARSGAHCSCSCRDRRVPRPEPVLFAGPPGADLAICSNVRPNLEAVRACSRVLAPAACRRRRRRGNRDLWSRTLGRQSAGQGPAGHDIRSGIARRSIQLFAGLNPAGESAGSPDRHRKA